MEYLTLDILDVLLRWLAGYECISGQHTVWAAMKHYSEGQKFPSLQEIPMACFIRFFLSPVYISCCGLSLFSCCGLSLFLFFIFLFFLFNFFWEGKVLATVRFLSHQYALFRVMAVPCPWPRRRSSSHPDGPCTIDRRLLPVSGSPPTISVHVFPGSVVEG